MKKQRKLGFLTYIFVCFFVILTYTASWVTTNFWDITPNSLGPKVWAIMGIINICFFSLFVFIISVHSLYKLITSFKYRNENNASSISFLSVLFNLILVAFAIFICVFYCIWIVNMFKYGVSGDGPFIKNDRNYSWLDSMGYASKAYISGIESDTEFKILAIQNGIYADYSFIIYIFSFIFILLWCTSGFVFELIRNRVNKNDDDENVEYVIIEETTEYRME